MNRESNSTDMGAGGVNVANEVEKRRMLNGPDLNDGWKRLSKPESGMVQRCGLHTIFSAEDHTSKFIAICDMSEVEETEEGGEIEIDRKEKGEVVREVLGLKLKSVKMVGVGKQEGMESIAYVLFGCKSISFYFCLCMDVRSGGKWTLSQVWR